MPDPLAQYMANQVAERFQEDLDKQISRILVAVGRNTEIVSALTQVLMEALVSVIVVTMGGKTINLDDQAATSQFIMKLSIKHLYMIQKAVAPQSWEAFKIEKS